MTSQEFADALKGLADAWTAKDYPRAAAFFTPDVRYIDPLRYALDSRASLQAFFEDDDGQDQRTTWHTILFDETQQLGVAEYTYVGSRQYHGVVIVGVADGRFARWREYQHVTPQAWAEFFAGAAG